MCFPMGGGVGGQAAAPAAPTTMNPLQIVQDKIARSDYTVAGEKGEAALAEARSPSPKLAIPSRFALDASASSTPQFGAFGLQAPAK